jgi:uncharacterized membrane protein
MRKYLITGLLIWIPLAITIWVLHLIVSSMDQVLTLLPPALQPAALFGHQIPGLGLALTVIVVFVTGVAASNIIGQRLLRIWEAVLRRIPVVNSLYGGVKQISDTLFRPGGQAFRKAVLVQWPRDGSWTIAFLTGVPGGDVANHLDASYVSIYVPTTPNPTGGYFVMLPRSEVVELDMSVDEALKYIISMGVATPLDNGRASALMRPAVVDQKAANQ